MYRKICPYCKNASYSSYKEGVWICPHCNMDITETDSEDQNIFNEDRKKGGKLDAFFNTKNRLF